MLAVVAYGIVLLFFFAVLASFIEIAYGFYLFTDASPPQRNSQPYQLSSKTEMFLLGLFAGIHSTHKVHITYSQVFISI